LRSADLHDADLHGADLHGADLIDTKVNSETSGYFTRCPEEGSFIGWKTASNYLIKLQITAQAKRSSATTSKCRCSEAMVLGIYAGENLTDLKACESNYDSSFVYTVGQLAVVNDFNEDRWKECASGIHFFLTKREAHLWK
jgi:hypothetical protein